MKKLVIVLFIISFCAWVIVLDSNLYGSELLSWGVVGSAFLIITIICLINISPKSTLAKFLEVRGLELDKRARDLRKELGIPDSKAKPKPETEVESIETPNISISSDSAEESKSETGKADNKKTRWAVIEKIFVLIISTIVVATGIWKTYLRESAPANLAVDDLDLELKKKRAIAIPRMAGSKVELPPLPEGFTELPPLPEGFSEIPEAMPYQLNDVDDLELE
jgi:hypothetical protein